ncbi:ATP-binding cassette domain-containing protein [bacterium]|nr:ATP-binding cassette domain-containing protein [bacterium]
MKAASVELTQVRKQYGARMVFNNLSLKISAGSFTSIVGSSGGGKSTLLRILAGVSRPDSGQVVRSEGARIGFVFQEPQLLPWRTVLQNASLPGELLRESETTDRARAALNLVGLGDALGLYPRQLSGGMKMRVSLARALALKPSLLVLDEPFAALDELTRFRLEEELHAVWEREKMTIVLVTHSFTEAVFLSNEVLFLSSTGQGLVDSLETPLGEKRTRALWSEPRFSALVTTCRDKFEKMEASGAR